MPVLYALFDAEEQLDRRAMLPQVKRASRAGVDGIVVLGLATEVAKLSEAECRDVIAWAAEDIAGASHWASRSTATRSQRAIAAARCRPGWGGWPSCSRRRSASYSAAELCAGHGRIADAATGPSRSKMPRPDGPGLGPVEGILGRFW